MTENEKLVNRITQALLNGGRSRKRSGDHLDAGKDETSRKKKLFQVQLNVKGYKPEELSVEVLDGRLLVKGRHEESQKDENSEEYALRHFKRAFMLPTNIIEDRLECKLSSNGKSLEVTAPLKCVEPAPEPAVRTIPISVEKPAAVKEAPATTAAEENENTGKDQQQRKEKDKTSAPADTTN